MNKYSLLDITMIIVGVAEEFAIDPSVLLKFARIESYFDPDARNGASRGLFQFQEAAWEDVSKEIYLPAYPEAVFNPYWNTKACAQYLKINARRLAASGMDVETEPRWYYMAHQQGVSGLIELYRASKGLSINGIVTVDAMLRNPPPGGTRPRDRALFYQQWMKHLGTIF